ncbi:MAG: hypothetical protein JWQ90_3616 [Hydrocarboniphaga sp.]|uniref:DUF1302 domain-containing protein n=1 Tax=Hydrocarboniphaga sp. TaxID=2033016 RepID=UPI00260D25A6|nr:DUF1302 family protein [Hydrocarboniphaga sp.]MDB5971166.1 hypothetical protein [Hydrocarboniphaga sp.]
MNVKRHMLHRWNRCDCARGALGFLLATSACATQAAQIYSDGDWSVQWNNTAAYSVGMRMQDIDPGIGNNPLLQNSEYKFDDVGDIVTNRLSLLTEIGIRHGNDYGLRVSADAWHDFAYDNHTIKTNPDLAAYSSGNPDNEYSHYIKRYYNQGLQLDDAFVYSNTDLFGTPVQIKAGRLTEFWGNALFAGFQSISYSQSPLDVIKATTAPGTEVKELFLPRAQLSLHAQLSDSLAVGAQYFLEWRANRLPEGGTFLGIVDPAFFSGSGSIEGQVPRGPNDEPDNLHNNLGVNVKWQPDGDYGTLGFYYRHFDETMPYTPILIGLGGDPLAPYYHLSFARNVDLYGLSLDRNLGPVSLGLEASYRRGTALYSMPGGVSNTDGAKGNTLNVVANGIYGLTPNFLYDTGAVILEVAYTRVLDVTSNEELYNGEGYAPCAGLGRTDGCATKDNVSTTLNIDPQWLQVFPGTDIDLPLNFNIGVYGNGQYLGTAFTGNVQGSVAYSLGVRAVYRGKYSVKLAYNGYYAEPGKQPSQDAGAGPYVPTGTGTYMWNDKGWLSLVLKASF